MLGFMKKRVGIVGVETGKKNRYYIKSEYLEFVKSILREFW